MIKQTTMPKYYKPVFCQEGVEVMVCDNVGTLECNYKCNLGKAYLHYLKEAKIDALRGLRQDGLDIRMLNKYGPEFRESEFFGRRR